MGTPCSSCPVARESSNGAGESGMAGHLFRFVDLPPSPVVSSEMGKPRIARGLVNRNLCGESRKLFVKAGSIFGMGSDPVPAPGVKPQVSARLAVGRGAETG